MKTVNISSSRNSRLQSRCNGSALVVTLLVLSALGGVVTLQTLRLYQKQQSANREIRKTLAKKQASLVADEVIQRFNGRKVTFFAMEAEKSLRSYVVDIKPRDLGTDDFERFFCPNPSDNTSNTRISVKILPKLSENFVNKGNFTLDTLRKRLRETALTSKVPLLNASQKEILFERWRFLQRSERNEPLKIPLFMPIFTFIGQKFDRKDTECTLWNPYDRPLKGTFQFKCLAELLDEQGNLFVDQNIEFALDVTLPSGREATFNFDKLIPNLDRLLHVEIKNCPKAYERRDWDIPMMYTCGWPFGSETKSSQQPRNEARQNPKSPELPPSGILFNTQTQPQRLDACLVFHCDKIYHSVGQRERTFFADAENSKDIPWNIFSQNPPSSSIPFYFFGTEEALFKMYPPASDEKEFWKFFAYEPENSEEPTNKGNPTNNTQQFSVLQANIDTFVTFVCFETYSDLCVCEMEIKHTSNDAWEPQTARYHYQQKPKKFRKPLLPQKSTTPEPVILQSSDTSLEETKISPVVVVHSPENSKKEGKIQPTPQPTTVILETPQPSIPVETFEKPVEKIDTPPVVQPSRKRRKNSAPASVPFTQLQKENKSMKQDTENKQNTEHQKQYPEIKKQYPPDEAPNELGFSKPSFEVDASCDTDDASPDHRSSFRKSSMGSEADLKTEPAKYSKPSFDFKALRDDESRSRKGTNVSDVEVTVN